MKVIEIENLTWIRSDKMVLHQINWEVQKGEHWAIIGLNGSGKTSLLKMVTGYEWPTKGKIQILGNTYGQCEIQKVRESIGWVSSSLREEIHSRDSALDVVISGKFASIGLWQGIDQADQEQALDIMKLMDCRHLSQERFGTLSQGEKQKVIISRALMANPQLLILDEPCYGLDIRAREQVLTRIQAMGSSAHAPTLLYVTHQIEEILPAISHILLLKDGEVLCKGPKREILTSEHMSRAFEVDVNVEWANDRPWIRIGS